VHYREVVADLGRLSVVMPTYQRPIYALRNMRLLDRTGARIHVLDGSDEPIDPRRFADLSSRINYVHLPQSYEERLGHAAELVDTPFCVAIGDDDMHLPSGLAASIAALDADPELVAATGTALAVLRQDDNINGKLMYDALHGRAIVDDDPVQRMIEHLGHYLPSTVYAVTRTPVWRRAVQALTGKRFVPFRLGELQYEMTVAYAGKAVAVPHLMWLRSFENRSLWLGDDVPLAPWWEQAAASGERDEFAAYMGGALTDDVAQQPAAAKGALAAMDAYIRALNEGTLRGQVHPALPLPEWGRRVAEQGVTVNDAELAAAVEAFQSTPSELPPLTPAPRNQGLASRLGRRWRGSTG
jgi:glycosyltransferase domain-containing protein